MGIFDKRTPQEIARHEQRLKEIQSWPEWKINGACSIPIQMNLSREALLEVINLWNSYEDLK